MENDAYGIWWRATNVDPRQNWRHAAAYNMAALALRELKSEATPQSVWRLEWAHTRAFEIEQLWVDQLVSLLRPRR